MNTTIFAPATLVGSSGITVIRISGDETFCMLAKIFSKSAERFEPVDPEKLSSHTAYHGYVFHDESIVDEAVVTVFRSPNSYTGEDVAEISTHGGSFIYRKISNLLCSSGCIHAEPGEFTKRAYFNGKMDLAQAEAVADLVKAKTDQANDLALRQLTGKFSGRIKSLREELINYCSLLELELDFSEEGIDLVSKEDLLAKIDKLIEKFKDLTRTYESGKIILNGVNLAIIGKPNVGKSSIFNYFLRESRAIVSEIPGTTRDYLQEPLIMDGIQYNLIDTAGIRITEDVIEKEGVRRSKLKIEESDLVLEVIDLTNPDPNADNDVKEVSREKVIKVYNKVDIAPGGKERSDGISISAITGVGMDKLHKAINEKAKFLVMGSESSDIIIANERHRDCLLKSCEYLTNARNQILTGGGNELISFEIRAAMDSISEIIGKTANVDILNNIFTKFCIGK
ncbi:MAG: tRNA uridine-5-carboxymethylaminomethyl(34) synthesis GTPase MnmE [Ignavibacteria bacterium]|nr:tRNA uridine-5-carboxymethylaminomethyl(34) synthesis GTPase MnmE [Ignavibacteria bacterium]